jgi:sulfite exporter TauE/SafE
MLTAVLLGFLGSLAHCVGMCSAVMLIIGRHPALQNNPHAWFWAHLGRLTSYTTLGILAGVGGQLLWQLPVPLARIQSSLSFLFAITSFYMALAFAGLVPSIEGLFAALTPQWGKAMRRLTQNTTTSPLLMGVLWGLLPCGLVLSAWLNATTATSIWQAALSMALFGISTLPSLLLTRWAIGKFQLQNWSRPLVSLAMMVFGFQFAMRGFAALGWLNHLHWGQITLW